MIAGMRSIEFQDDTGKAYKFENVIDLRKFADEEDQYWTTVCDQLDRAQIDGMRVRAILLQGSAHVRQIIEEDEEPAFNRSFEDQRRASTTMIENYASGRWPTRTSVLTRKISKINVRDNDKLVTVIVDFLNGWGAEIKVGRDFSPPPAPRFFVEEELEEVIERSLNAQKNMEQAEVRAQNKIGKFESQIKEYSNLLKTLDKSSSNLTQSYERAELAREKLNEQGVQAGKLLSGFPEHVEKLCTEAANAAATQAAATVLADQELREPQTYWSDRQALHGRTRNRFMIGFFLLCLAAGIAIPVIAYQLFGDKVDVAYENWTVAFALLGAPSLMAVWIIRMAGKVYATHQALETDAAERVTMMKAFIALNASNKLTPDDKHLILKALFRPSQHVAEEEPMPSWIDAVFARAGSQSK
ncbi:MAG: hypothetical protein JKY94_01625 [Rhodobacteraceae bacterium]|nr:hypothetical protein [Paracoccaceae bacterium]